jgi:membrane-associated phospholipid phosphatase
MPLTALDALVPFQPAMLAPYLSLWFYVGIAPGLQPNFRELVVYGMWIAVLCLTGLACFYFWPTAVPPWRDDVSGLAGFELLQGVDAAGNACPSMHVAVAIFTAWRIRHVFREVGAPRYLRVVSAAWFVAIAWSTLAIRQHVVLDVLTGALLGTLFAAASLHWRPGSSRYHRPLVDTRLAP